MLALVALVALALASPALVRRWRRRQHTAITDPAHALVDLWDRALQALAFTGFRPDPALTPLEQSVRGARSFPALAAPLHDLAEVATAATYASSGEVSHLADESVHSDNGPYEWCAFIEDSVEQTLSIPERLRRYFTVWR